MNGTAANKLDIPNNRNTILLAVLLSATTLIVCLAIVGANWTWTGFKGNETLWDWLSMLATPIAIASLPVRIAAPDHVLVRRWPLMWPVLLAAAAVVIAGGYGLGWTWTGFAGEKLWDWLHLLLLPTVAVLLPEWFKKGMPIGRAGGIAALVLLAGFVLVIFGGYGAHWQWTGFEGNTFHDWLDLLIAPFLLPTACRWFQVQATQRAAGTDPAGTVSTPSAEERASESANHTETAGQAEAEKPAQPVIPAQSESKPEAVAVS
jgi:hypothetical protein